MINVFTRSNKTVLKMDKSTYKKLTKIIKEPVLIIKDEDIKSNYIVYIVTYNKKTDDMSFESIQN